MITRIFPFFLFACFAVSCSETNSPQEEANSTEATPAKEVAETKVPTEAKKAAPSEPTFWSEVKLHEVIRAANPGYTGNGQFQIDQAGQVQAIALDNCEVTDLSPLAGMRLMALYLQGCAVPDVKAIKGMPMVELYLENSAVKDLSPLAGMTELRKLYLSGTNVSDLSPLKGLGIVELNLVNTQVSDLSALKGMPLKMLWLTDSPVKDISPLVGSSLESLTLHRTPVTDLSPLANSTLQRLHIGETDVTDLSPLVGLRLTRIVFDPAKIKKGMEAIKQMPTMQQIGTKFEDGANDLQAPAVFWSAQG